MDVKIEQGWKAVLSQEFAKPYFKQLTEFVRNEYKTQTVYPAGREIFAAFDACPFDQLKVVILGQDPYHGPGQAHGLSFSVNDGVPLPPSLMNIYKELGKDLNCTPPVSGNLTHWAKQGVLLLNATLTVRVGQPTSHQKQGWETFTDAVIKLAAEQKNNLAFVLWGNYAQQKAAMIDESRHLILKSVHPSPLSASRGFFGSRPFSQINNYLIMNGQQPINWV